MFLSSAQLSSRPALPSIALAHSTPSQLPAGRFLYAATALVITTILTLTTNNLQLLLQYNTINTVILEN